MKTADILWLAGYLEGEGCFHHSFRRRAGLQAGERRDGSRGGLGFTIAISVASTDRDVLERAAFLMGAKIHARKLVRGRKPDYSATVAGVRAACWMMTLLPLMGRRRAGRIKEALAAWKTIPACPKRSTYLRAIRAREREEQRRCG
jgi:hypothetical protein